MKNPNSINAHNNMTAKISLHGQMIMSHLPEIRTVLSEGTFYGSAWKGPFRQSEIDVSVPGATCEGMARYVGLTELQCVRRMKELEDKELVVKSSEKFTYISGGKTYHKTIWKAVEK